MDVVSIRGLLISTAAQHHELGRQYSLLVKNTNDRHGEWLLGYLARSERWASRNIRNAINHLPVAVQNDRIRNSPEWIHGELRFYVADSDVGDKMALLDTALHFTTQLTDGLRMCRDQVSDPVGRRLLQHLIDMDVEFQSHLAHSLSIPLHLVPNPKAAIKVQ